MESPPGEITQLLAELRDREQDATPRLFELLYSELRRMAQNRLRRESPEHSLQATALVHEAYMRLAGAHPQWQNRAHFFAIASKAMRRVLVDHARTKQAAKRPDSLQKVNLDEAILLTDDCRDEMLILDQALDRLSKLDARQTQIVELRYFGGLTSPEVAEALGISTITVQRDWAIAKVWLHAELAGRPAGL